MYLHLRLSSSLILRPYAVSILAQGVALPRISLFFVQSFSPARSLLCFTQMVSISQRYQVGTLSPSDQSRQDLLPLVLPYSSILRHPYLSYKSPFRFETSTFQVLKSYCVHSPVHVFSFPQEGLFCLPSLYSMLSL